MWLKALNQKRIHQQYKGLLALESAYVLARVKQVQTALVERRGRSDDHLRGTT